MTCKCGHVRDSHRHYRPGTDCGMCLCNQYQEGSSAMDRLRALLTWVLSLLHRERTVDRLLDLDRPVLSELLRPGPPPGPGYEDKEAS